MLPSVTAVMLVNGRFAMTARAVQSFMAQTYPADRRYLLIWDTGKPHYAPPFVYDPHGIEIWHRKAGPTIGELRNEANAEAKGDIIVTFDSDDVSHGNRISEQVALLQSSGADCVGYNEALFWDTRWIDPQPPTAPRNEAWLYAYPTPSYALGASLCYWRKTWERNPFDAINHGEDQRFINKCKTVGVSSISHNSKWAEARPRMICSIHGGNTSPFDPATKPAMARRAPEFDAYCAEKMKL